ncbi:MAG: tRNA pseudouridine(55) synthase TruB [Rhodospirillales bacterium]|nr:tRNA pseudouridine(55) synthase TruB [Rhodospirillales bacterium]
MRARHRRRLDGWLVVDKPAGITSATVVNRVRRAFGAAKAGHGGTLDPLATGVLPVAFGAATKTVPYVMDGAKRYRFTLRWGEARDTDDADGAVVGISPVRPGQTEICAALAAFRGDIMQVPPTFSAVKVGGARAYVLARGGEPQVLAARPARVERFELVALPDTDHAEFEVVSGKGVYMRSLARDLALRLGTFGHVAALRRLRVGPFTDAEAIPLDKFDAAGDRTAASPDLLLPVATALADIPALALTAAEAAVLMRGQALSLVALMGRIPERANPSGGLLRAMAGGQVLGLGRLGDGWLKPERLLVPCSPGPLAERVLAGPRTVGRAGQRIEV